MNEIFHPLHTDIERPERFTYPFNYTPHPLCLLAAGELQRYIGSNGQWRDEVEKGKMFGVLVVTDAETMALKMAETTPDVSFRVIKLSICIN